MSEIETATERSGAWAHRSTESMMGFARLDDCLDMMVPSDLREIVGRLAREEKAHEQTLEDRDRLHEWADKLAQAIGGDDIGCHSNLNNPWANAIEIAEANARLMAEMLEALKDARYALYGNGPGNPKIDAAISKAEGSQP